MVDVPDDAELLKSYARDGAKDVFGELVNRYLPLVYHAALRQVGGNEYTAEDVAQIVFTRLARKASQLTGHRALAGWLHTTTRFAASEVMRAERRRRAREQEAYHMHVLANEEAGEPGVQWESLRPVIDDAVAALDARDREAVLLRFFSGLPLAQIGAKLNVSENAARMRVQRALDKLHVVLARRGITSTSAALGVVLANQAAAMTVPAGLAATVASSAIAGGTVSGALASGISGLAGSLGFMSTTKLFIAAAGIASLIIALGVATREVKSARTGESALAAEKQAYAAVAAELRAIGQRIQAAEQEAAQLKDRVAAANAEEAAAATRVVGNAAVAKPDATPDPFAAGDAFMARHPQVRTALEDYARARVDFRFNEFYRSLGLTAAQIEQFRPVVSQGLSMGAVGSGGELMQLRSGDWPASGITSRLREILGKQVAKAYSDYGVWTEPAREIATRVAGALWFTDTPLTPQQSGQLVDIMTSSRATPNGGPKERRTPGKFERYDWATVLAKAPNVLAPAQLEALRGEYAREQFNASINRPINTGATTGSKEAER